MIVIRTEVLPEAFRWDPRNPKTGTNRFYVRVAEGLAEGMSGNYPVVVQYDGPTTKHNRVLYLNRASDLPADGLADVVFDMNYQGKFGSVGNAVKLQWTSFFGRPDLCNGDGYDRLFLVSEYVHSTLAHAVKCPVTVLELGCDHEVVDLPLLHERPLQCCYTSSPDRGGAYLDRIWPEVERATGYSLVKSPYGEEFSDEQMKDLYRSSRFWVFPAIGTDSIISALEAQAAGCIPFVVAHMGLPETLRYKVTTDLFRFKEDLIRTLNEFPEQVDALMAERDNGLQTRPISTWADVVKNIRAFL